MTQNDDSVERLRLTSRPSREARRQLLHAVRAAGQVKAVEGPSAARSQDLLYGEDGLPR